MRTPIKRGHRAVPALLLLGIGLAPAGAFAAVSGTVFHDYNSNGLRDTGSTSTATDRGVAGVTVRAFDAAGACGTPATSNASGGYSVTTTGCAAGTLRLEFSTLPAGLLPSFHARPSSGPTTAAQAGTTVQFAADGTSNLEVALNAPDTFCQNDPQLAVSVQAFGDPQAPANAALDAVVRFPYSVAGSVGTPQPVAPVGLAGVPEVGAIYGLALDRLGDSLYVGAYHKRHAGFGPVGTGAIYRVNGASTGAPAAPVTFVNLNAVFGPGTAGTDTVRGNYESGDLTWDEVGKSSLADLELNGDSSRLYAINMADRQLYTIPTSGPLDTGTISRVAIPHPCAVASDARPFGLGYRDGVLYVGGVCSAQSTNLAANLSAWIYSFNTGTATFSATPVMQFALTYARAHGNDDAIADPSGTALWRPWTASEAGNAVDVRPEPMLSDITFDGADMVIGFRDRHGDQTGTGNGGTIRGITAGEILRACSDGSGGWNLEQNGTCGGVTGAAGTATNQARGPGSTARGGEFYPLDHYSNTSPPFFINDTPPDYNGRHDETAQGALIQVPGYALIASTVMDPFRFNSGGLRWYSNVTPADPALSRGYEIFIQSGAIGFSKANGLGDADPLCRAAPVEVGNYVWNDTNRNGVMDPGEPPIANVQLRLHNAAGTSLGVATTDANGEYYFSFSQGATDANLADNLIVAPNPYSTSYTIGVDAANFSAGGALLNLRATTPDNDVSAGGDQRDSDGVAVTIPASTTTLGATFTLAGAGNNNHTIDFGFGAVDFGDLPDTGAGTAPGNYNTSAGDNGPSHGIVPGLQLGATVDAETDGQPNIAANGDDNAGTPDDEDGVLLASLQLVAGTPANVSITATNTTARDARICGFIDFNRDGDFADAGESSTVAVPVATNNATLVLNFGTVPLSAAPDTYARFRIDTGTAPCSPTGPQPDGEVEDYPVGVAVLDFGDLPDGSAGTGAGNYQTLVADNGPRHVIVPGLRLGAEEDAEADGQPNVGADGDDNSSTPDDEDGVVTGDLALTAGSNATVRVNATNTTAQPAQLCGFIDFNGDGDFADAGETGPAVSVPAGSNNVQFSINFGTVPLTAGNSYARFRLSSNVGACTPTGLAPDGEVEDYVAGVTPLDFGDLPDTGAGTGPGNYNTVLADNAARHGIVPNLFMGAGVDADADGQPNAAANGDDIAGTPDDEDGVNTADLSMIAGTPATVRVTATNLSPFSGRVCGFVDFNGDGDFADAGESATVPVPLGTSNATLTLNFGTVPLNAASSTYARFRLSTSLAACTPVGAELQGEVEDYPVSIGALDYGDLPDSGAGSGPGNYATLNSDNGARHTIVPQLFLGAGVDAEADGQPGAGANTDDATSSDDEDGVNTADLALQRGVAPAVRVTGSNSTGSAATVCGFIDYNADGDFADAGEAAQATLANGSSNAQVTLNFGAVPNGAAATSYARFRVSTGAGCSPTGAAVDGEVEDYPVNVGAGPLSLGNLVWNDRNNNGTVDPGEPGLGGVSVVLYPDSNGDGVPDGAPVGSTTTDGNGNYSFVNLDPDTYLVEITPPAGYLGSTCSGFPYATTGTCEPAADPDNDIDNDDNGTAQGGTIRSGPVTLTVGGEPTNDGDGSNGNQTVDFGLLGNFDLALTKRLGAGQSGPFIPGQDVSFDIVVINQGGIAAQNILVNDYIPAGFALSPAAIGWTSVSPTLATQLIAGPLAPGASTTLSILLRVQAGAVSPLVNRAEIGAADDDGDGSNTPPGDVDSTPDNDPSNDAGGGSGTPADDATGGNGSGTPGDGDAAGDEDDADPAEVPVGNGSAVLGVAKAAQVLNVTGGGGYGDGGSSGTASLAYVIVVRNYSAQTVNNLQVTESLSTAFGSGNNWSVSSVTAPALALNPGFDGRNDTALLAGSDSLAPGATATIRIVLSVQFSAGAVYSNQVTGSGLVGVVPVSDLSHNGTDPAPGGDPATAGDPTVTRLGSLAIPALSPLAASLLVAGLALLALGAQRRRRMR
jgi:uncharacterized repeat protein (TIGR01451 family)